jgi:hypothetical protein
MSRIGAQHGAEVRAHRIGMLIHSRHEVVPAIGKKTTKAHLQRAYEGCDLVVGLLFHLDSLRQEEVTESL